MGELISMSVDIHQFLQQKYQGRQGREGGMPRKEGKKGTRKGWQGAETVDCRHSWFCFHSDFDSYHYLCATKQTERDRVERGEKPKNTLAKRKRMFTAKDTSLREEITLLRIS